jgi:hypothetical protein
MDFDTFHLSPLVMAGLYKHTLVLLDGENIGMGKWAAGALTNANNGQQAIENDTVQQLAEPVFTTIVTAVTAVKPAAKPVETNLTTDKNITVELPTPQPVAEIEKTPLSTQPISSPAIKYLGGFGKKISIVLEDHFHPNINDENLAFLTKLLQACQLSLNDVAIINVVSNSKYSSQLWQLMPADKMIIFEVDPGTLGLPFRMPHFRLQPWSDCVFLASPSLEALQENTSEKVVQLKRHLWENLKKMFLA